MSQQPVSTQSTDRDSFRLQFGVRLVTDQEEGFGVRRLPEGVYGFTGAPATEELPLFGRRIYQGFEVHKWPGGVVAWVGYLTEKEYVAYEKGEEPVSVDLYPEPYGESTRIVAIPEGRVDRRRPPTRESGNCMRMDLGPKG